MQKILNLLTSNWMIEPQYFHTGIEIFERKYIKNETLSEAQLIAAIGEKEYKEESNIDGIAIIPVYGVLANHFSMIDRLSVGGTSPSEIMRKIKEALGDESIKKILLDINSPGGTVAFNFELADFIYDSRCVKPIECLVSDKATSAAYLIASATSKIYVLEEGTQVGSIGVVTSHIETHENEKQKGIKITEVAIPKNKRIRSQHEPLSEEGLTNLQSILEKIYNVFVEKVSLYRGIPEEKIRATDGLVFLAKDAMELGLIDGIMARDQLLRSYSNDSENSIFAMDNIDTNAAEWTARYINDLPDAAFAIVKPGGEKDEEEKTVPRTLRMLPHHNEMVKNPNENNTVDLPHLRNALARVNQPETKLTEEERIKARNHLQRHAVALGVGEQKENNEKEAIAEMQENEKLQAAITEKNKAIEELRKQLENVKKEKFEALIEKNLATFKGEMESMIASGQAYPFEVKMYGKPDYCDEEGNIYFSTSTILGIMAQRPESGITTEIETPKPKVEKELTPQAIDDLISKRMKETGEEYATAAIELQRRGEIPSYEEVM